MCKKILFILLFVFYVNVQAQEGNYKFYNLYFTAYNDNGAVKNNFAQSLLEIYVESEKFNFKKDFCAILPFPEFCDFLTCDLGINAVTNLEKPLNLTARDILSEKKFNILLSKTEQSQAHNKFVVIIPKNDRSLNENIEHFGFNNNFIELEYDLVSQTLKHNSKTWANKDEIKKIATNNYKQRDRNLYEKDLLDNFKKLFDKKIKHDTEKNIFFVMGHGGYNSSIAGLTIENFKRVFKFLNKRLNPAMLYIISCYAGSNSYSFIKDVEEIGKFSDIKFPIIFGGIYGGVVYSKILMNFVFLDFEKIQELIKKFGKNPIKEYKHSAGLIYMFPFNYALKKICSFFEAREKSKKYTLRKEVDDILSAFSIFALNNLAECNFEDIPNEILKIDEFKFEFYEELIKAKIWKGLNDNKDKESLFDSYSSENILLLYRPETKTFHTSSASLSGVKVINIIDALKPLDQIKIENIKELILMHNDVLAPVKVVDETLQKIIIRSKYQAFKELEFIKKIDFKKVVNLFSFSPITETIVIKKLIIDGEIYNTVVIKKKNVSYQKDDQFYELNYKEDTPEKLVEDLRKTMALQGYEDFDISEYEKTEKQISWLDKLSNKIDNIDSYDKSEIIKEIKILENIWAKAKQKNTVKKVIKILNLGLECFDTQISETAFDVLKNRVDKSRKSEDKEAHVNFMKELFIYNSLSVVMGQDIYDKTMKLFFDEGNDVDWFFEFLDQNIDDSGYHGTALDITTLLGTASFYLENKYPIKNFNSFLLLAKTAYNKQIGGEFIIEGLIKNDIGLDEIENFVVNLVKSEGEVSADLLLLLVEKDRGFEMAFDTASKLIKIKFGRKQTMNLFKKLFEKNYGLDKAKKIVEEGLASDDNNFKQGALELQKLIDTFKEN